MLLRSSSTPILSSLSSHHASHPETLKEVEFECDSSLSLKAANRSLPYPSPSPAFRSRSVSHGSQSCLIVDEKSGGCEFGRESVPRQGVRRAQSESDLLSLGNGWACKSAADSLITSSADERNSTGPHKSWSRRLSLMRHSNSNGEGPGRSCGSRRHDSILEESSAFASELEEQCSENVNDDSSLQDTATLPQSNQKRRCAVRQEDLDTNFFNGSLQTPGAPSELSVSWRNGGVEGFLMEDGVMYTSFDIAANGQPVVCNSNGCRLLYESEKSMPMFIARGLGLGIGGGHHRGSGKGGRGGEFEAESNSTEAYYLEMLQADPENPLLLRNYAMFLHEVKHDHRRAEEYYQRAILADPRDGDVLSQYAKLVWDVNRDGDRAESYFEQAVEAAPDDCYVHASYASFLWESEDNEQQDDSSLSSSCPQPLPALHGASLGPAPLVASA